MRLFDMNTEFRLLRVGGDHIDIDNAFLENIDIQDPGSLPIDMYMGYLVLQHRQVTKNGDAVTDWQTVPIVDGD